MPNLEPNAEPTLGHDDDGDKDDVEGHGLSHGRGGDKTPHANRDDESDDVEAHVLGDKVFVDRPNAS